VIRGPDLSDEREQERKKKKKGKRIIRKCVSQPASQPAPASASACRVDPPPISAVDPSTLPAALPMPIALFSRPRPHSKSVRVTNARDAVPLTGVSWAGLAQDTMLRCMYQ